MQGVGQRRDLGVERGDLVAGRCHAAQALLTFPGQLIAPPRRGGDDTGQVAGDLAAGLGDGGGDLSGVLTGRPGLLRTHPGIAFGSGRPPQRISLSANGIRALLGGAHGLGVAA